MSDNDIALSFDTAKYYSLQEACDYLNRKYKTDNITPNKLLKQIYIRNINSFIHFRMNNLSKNILRFQIDCYGSNIFTESIYDLEKDELEPLVEKIERVESYVSNRFIDELFMGHILFKLDTSTLFNMSLNRDTDNTTPLLLIDGFVHSHNIDDDPAMSSKLREWSLGIDGKDYYFTDTGAISIVIDSIDDDDLAEFNNKVPFLCTFDKRDNFTFAELNIKICDLTILHQDLLTLEREMLNHEPIADENKIKARKGVNHKKVLAKEFAKHIADERWQQDTENKIKVGEMCDIVWSKLIDSDLAKALPEHRENIKPWIKEVTPAYASEAGRPPL